MSTSGPARDPSGGSLHAEQPVEPGRNADRSAAVAAGRDRHQPARDRGGRAARRTAGGAGRVPRVAGDAVQLGDADVEAAELRCRGLAEEVGARRSKPRRPSSSRDRRCGPRTRATPRCRASPSPVELLHGDRHATEGQVDVGGDRAFACRVDVEVRERVQRRWRRWRRDMPRALRPASSSPDRNASTSEQASPSHGPGMRVRFADQGRGLLP